MSQFEAIDTLESYEDYQHFSISDRLAIAATALAFTFIISLLIIAAPK